MNQSQHDNQINIIRRNDMKTTLNEIKAKSPCGSGWRKLLGSLDKTEADDAPIDLMYILKSNGIQDAVWALRCFDFKDYCLFLADVAESVLPILLMLLLLLMLLMLATRNGPKLRAYL